MRNIRIIGDDILRKKSRPVEEINARILTLLDDMRETMYESGGVGLAAPQVGILRRIAVIDVGEELGDGLLELINPEIIAFSGEQTEAEGCLSVPEYIGTVTRPETVTVRAQNREGEVFEKTVSGFFARAVCHELDHLEGLLFVDKAEEIQKRDEE
ncbi:MAG: peptide deformylase [Ruminococcaceae bacterium]|nr:peptide deformylase [Oscillospiraceae bacterium]